MPDDLDISGGTTSVSTEDLDVAVEQLGRLSSELGALAWQLASIESPRGGVEIEQSRADIEHAATRLAQLGHRAGDLQLVLGIALRGYIAADQLATIAARGVGNTAAQLLGWLLPGRIIGAGLGVSIAGGLWWGIRAAGGLGPALDGQFQEKGIPKANSFWRENNWLITNPGTVSVIRGAAQSLGAFRLGTMGLPASAAPGTRAFEFGSKGVVALGNSQGLFLETPVRLAASTALPVSGSPQSFVDRLERVPYFEDESGPQVVIERYTVPGEADRFEVYVGGTVTFSPAATTEPWDMTSNMTNATGDVSGSVASVQQAMEAAGIDADSPVQLTGYSQGGGTVARLAATDSYNVQGITTFGGPTGQVRLPDGVPAVLVEHADDPVPALGGEQDNARAVLVRRDVFGGEVIPHEYGVPAHHIEYYLETARLMDESGSPQLDETIAQLDGFTEGATMQASTAYRFERSGK